MLVMQLMITDKTSNLTKLLVNDEITWLLNAVEVLTNIHVN